MTAPDSRDYATREEWVSALRDYLQARWARKRREAQRRTGIVLVLAAFLLMAVFLAFAR
jgi:hypothetical protein